MILDPRTKLLILSITSISVNYLKRKANGKQKEYEDRYKARREEKKQEKLRSLKRAGIPVSEYEKRD